MPIWEYKVITSGSFGFATPQLLEQHLNQLGKEEWEIIHFQTRPDNPLAFSGLARRPVMRDWVVEPAPAAAPSLRSGAVPAPPEETTADAPSARELQAEAEQRRESLLAREESLRPLQGDSEEDEDAPSGAAGLESLDEEEDLPTFFEAIRPHMRRNPKGHGMAVGIEYLAKKFGQPEAHLIEALKECGFAIPTSPRDDPVHLEYDGDLYWLNLNSRRQLWINTHEKPRAAFRPVAGKRVTAVETPATETRTAESGERPPDQQPVEATRVADRESEAPPAAPLPGGPGLFDRLRPMMRRNRRDSGLSGSITYLARALKSEPAALEAAFAAAGLGVPTGGNAPPVFVDIGSFVYWLNRDRSGQIWINAREPGRGGTAEAASGGAEPATAQAPVPQTELPLVPAGEAARASSPPASPLTAVRLLLKETTRGGVAAEVGNLAKQLHKDVEELEAALVGTGLRVPAKPREKPVFVEHAGEIFWLNRNARGELWLNAKASKFARPTDDPGKPGESPAGEEVSAGPRHRRSRRKGDDPAGGSPAAPAQS